MNTFPVGAPMMPLASDYDADANPGGAAQTPSTDALESAHARTNDAAKGFETMVEKAEPEFRPVVERFLTLHRRHAATLADSLAAHGVAVDEGGTLMGAINQAVVATRAFFDDIDADVITQILNGEARVVDAYEAAMTAEYLPRTDRDTVGELHRELTSLIAETRHLG